MGIRESVTFHQGYLLRFDGRFCHAGKMEYDLTHEIHVAFCDFLGSGASFLVLQHMAHLCLLSAVITIECASRNRKIERGFVCDMK